jgi:hypothetical protein
MLNEPNSLNDGNYSSINSTLNDFEIQLIIRFLYIEVEDFTHADLKIFGRIRQIIKYSTQMFMTKTIKDRAVFANGLIK